MEENLYRQDAKSDILLKKDHKGGKVMELQKPVMEIITGDWTTSKALAKVIADNYPEEFKEAPYLGDLSTLSMALGPVLWALRNQGLIEDDGTKWPATKRWRRTIPKESISVDDVAEALVKLHHAKDKDQAIRMLAARTVRERRKEFKDLIDDASRISEEAMTIGKKMLGLEEQE